MSDHPEVVAAIQAGDVESLRILLTEDPSRSSARDEAGISAIMHALYRRRSDMVDLLLAAGPHLDIFEACSLGRGQVAGELLDQHPGLASEWSADGFTALHFACFFAHPEIAAALLGAWRRSQRGRTQSHEGDAVAQRRGGAPSAHVDSSPRAGRFAERSPAGRMDSLTLRGPAGR